MITFGYRLKELRNELNMNQTELGKVFKVEKGTISNWENDNRFPDKDMLNIIADYFNVSIDYLLGRSSIKNLEEMLAIKEKSKEVETIAAHLKDKDITPKKMKLIKNYIDALFDEDE